MKVNLCTFLLLISTYFTCKAANYYWIGGSGGWSQYASHWATTSGGGTFHIQVPTSNDNVYFDNNSFTAAGQTVTMDIPGVCASMNWTGADAIHSGTTNGPCLGGSSQLEIFGSLIFAVGMRPSTYQGVFRLLSNAAGNTIDTKGYSFYNKSGNTALSFEGAGQWTVSSTLTTVAGIQHLGGTLNLGSQNSTIGFLYSNATSTRTLNLNSSIITLTGPSLTGTSLLVWNVSLTNLTFNAGTANIIVSQVGSTNFNGGGATYYNITSTSQSYLNLNNNNVVANLRCDGSAFINGNNTITSSMTLTKGREYLFRNNSTQTFNAGAIVIANGDCSGLVSIRSTSIVSSEYAYFNATSWAGSSLNYVVLFNMRFSTPISATNSVDNRLNVNVNFSLLAGKNLYWVGGSGNWNNGNKWSLTSGGAPSGCIPTPYDNVFFDANSFTAGGQQVLIDTVNAYCKDMNWTGSTNMPTLISTGSSSISLNIYGSLTFIASMTNSFVRFTYFWGSGTHTITSATQTFKSDVFITGIGTYSLIDGLEVDAELFLHAGTFTTNNQYVKAKRFNSPNRGVSRTMNMGSSIYTISNDNVDKDCWSIISAGMTLNSGTSTINIKNRVINLRTAFKGGGLIHYNVHFQNAEVEATITNLNTTFYNLTFDGDARIGTTININNSINFTAGKTYTVSESMVVNLIGSAALNANGNCSNYIVIKSSGTQQGVITRSSGIINVSYVSLYNMSGTGGATYNASNSIDQGLNTGWLITGGTARELYWVGGTGNWSDLSKWSTSSGGTSGACPPTPADNVYFDANSFTATGQSVNIDVDVARCKNMNWTGALYSPSFALPIDDALEIYGSLTLIASITVSNYLGNTYFKGSGANTITTAGLRLRSREIFFNSNTGSYTFLDDFSTSTSDGKGKVFLVSGTLNTNNVNVTFNAFGSNYANERTLNLGSSRVNVLGRLFNGSTDWDARGANFTLNAGTSSIFLPAFAHTSMSYLGDKSYYNVGVNPYSGVDSKISIFGNNTFNTLKLASNTLIDGSNTFVDTLYLKPNHVYTFQNGSTQTFGANTHVGAVGTGAGPIYVQSATAGTSAFWTKPSGRVCADYIYIRDIRPSGGATFTGGANANDQGNTVGWNFDPYPVSGAGALLGADTLCPGESSILSFTLTGALPKTIIYWDGVTKDTIKNVLTNSVTDIVTPTVTSTFSIFRIDVDVCFGGVVGKSGTALIKVLDGTAGLWTGLIDTNWFVCKNWANGSIPTTTTNVLIPGSVTKMPLIGGPGAVCRNIEIATSANLSMPPSSSTLNVYGHFKNDGSFLQGLGTVEFSGNSLSDISGNSAIRFYNLKQSNSVGIRLLKNVEVQNVLTLNDGYLNLNANTLTEENADVTAIIRNDGYILSENSLNLSKVTWKIGSVTGSHRFPFGKVGHYIPLTLNLIAGAIGDVTISTYATVSNNTLYPVSPEPVASASFISHTDNINNVVDRFWQIDKSGLSGTANVTFTYADDEIPNNGEAGLRPYRYSSLTSKWQKQTLTQTQDLALNTVTIAGLSTFSPWTLILPTSPLPLELVSFDVDDYEGKPVISWVINHDPSISKYTIERSKDGFSFDSVGSIHTSNLSGLQNFSHTDIKDLKGLNYYRVKWDYSGGLVKYSPLESIELNSSHTYFKVSAIRADEVHLFSNQEGDEGLQVSFFNTLGTEIATYLLKSGDGKSNTTLDLSASLTPGVYIVTATNNINTYRRSIVIQ